MCNFKATDIADVISIYYVTHLFWFVEPWKYLRTLSA